MCIQAGVSDRYQHYLVSWLKCAGIWGTPLWSYLSVWGESGTDTLIVWINFLRGLNVPPEESELRQHESNTMFSLTYLNHFLNCSLDLTGSIATKRHLEYNSVICSVKWQSFVLRVPHLQRWDWPSSTQKLYNIIPSKTGPEISVNLNIFITQTVAFIEEMTSDKMWALHEEMCVLMDLYSLDCAHISPYFSTHWQTNRFMGSIQIYSSQQSEDMASVILL